ncbi:MAG: hypothetical protein EPO39_14585 [Candidatus Manganitrophaceae bacterium]|nr:MAG: hypothetical protein EPO39_14585 [Candidatus Manganitrophaceae bacterium]
MSKRAQQFLTGSGLILLAVGFGRISILFRSRAEDPFFAPHLLVTLLSVWIATSILRVGLRKKEITPRAALALIRSGSILLMIWSYRLYLVLKTVRSPIDLKAHFYLAFLYMVMGTMVMLFGLRTSRALRKKAAQAVAPSPVSLTGALSEDPAEK